jgi:hypothetical protein
MLSSPAAFAAPIDSDDDYDGGAVEKELTSNDADSEDNYLLNGGFQFYQ